MSERVSVIIPVYNRPVWIEEALQSVLCQTHPQLEVLLCDDGSDTETAAACDRLAELYPDRVRVLHLPHQGPGPAREAGRQAARGEFIQYLDSDDRLSLDKFERQIAALRAHPGCGIAYGRTRLIDSDGNVLQESYKQIHKRNFLFPGLLVDRWWCTHTPLYRSVLCDRVGPWSDLRYSQDWEYDARIGALKTKLVFVDAVGSDHRDHSDPQRQTGEGRWLGSADQVRFFKSLYECAVRAGVKRDAPEMKHFVRWLFAGARAAGCDGLRSEARALLALSRRAAGGSSAQLSLYGLLATCLGWRVTGRVLGCLRGLRSGRAGAQTMKQSWMGEEQT